MRASGRTVFAVDCACEASERRCGGMNAHSGDTMLHHVALLALGAALPPYYSS